MNTPAASSSAAASPAAIAAENAPAPAAASRATRRAAAALAAIPRIEMVKLSTLIVDYKFNMRDEADYDRKDPDMVNLTDSIKAHGKIDEPVIVTHTKDGRYILDAGFRRYTAADRIGIKESIAIVFDREENDPARRQSNSLENAKKALSWQSQARLAASMKEGTSPFSDDAIAADMVVHKKHVQLLLRVHTKMAALVESETIPAGPAAELNLNEARELVQFKKSEVVDAWNYFVKHGKFPARKEKEVGGEDDGEGGEGGEGKESKEDKKARLDDLADRLNRSVPGFEWATLAKHFPAKSEEDLTAIVTLMNNYRESVRKGK